VRRGLPTIVLALASCLGPEASTDAPDASSDASSDVAHGASHDAAAEASDAGSDATAVDAQEAGPPACLATCQGSCVDPTSDPKHCGSCNVACASGVACVGGICGRSLFKGPNSSSPCATKSDGSLWCWGDDGDFQGGLGASAPAIVGTPTRANVLSGQVLYAASSGHTTCALLASGSVSCFGGNTNGELGIGTFGGPDTCSGGSLCHASPVTPSIDHVIELSGDSWWCGGSHFCARTADGVSCWGDEGGCGANAPVATPTAVSGLGRNVVQMVTATTYNCVLLSDGTVWCWGGNEFGGLGQGDTQPRAGLVQVPLPGKASILGGGHLVVCARTADGLYCWGDNAAGEAGVGATDCKPVTQPTKVVATGLDDVVQISSEQLGTCALTAAGTVFCWGAPVMAGNVAAPSSTCQGSSCAVPAGFGCMPSPTVAASLSGVVEMSMGNNFVLTRLGDGSLMVWGGNTAGQLGNPNAGSPQTTPIAVVGFP
jgi:alpha-tubulin suppressor-like RCC1 family protein